VPFARAGTRSKRSVGLSREETHVRGVSVATVARRHEVNANQVFAWRQLYRRGLLMAMRRACRALLPVKLMTPTVLPSERVEQGGDEGYAAQDKDGLD
jgi:hypothetical protein